MPGRGLGPGQHVSPQARLWPQRIVGRALRYCRACHDTAKPVKTVACATLGCMLAAWRSPRLAGLTGGGDLFEALAAASSDDLRLPLSGGRLGGGAGGANGGGAGAREGRPRPSPRGGSGELPPQERWAALRRERDALAGKLAARAARGSLSAQQRDLVRHKRFGCMTCLGDRQSCSVTA